MAQVIGTIRSVIGEVKVKNPLTGEERILGEGDQVFQGELLLTGPIGSVSLELANGETLSLGRASSLNLSDELISTADSPLQAETVTSIEALRQAIFESNGPIEVEATAAGDDESSLQAAVVIDRLGLEGQVDTAFDTSATNTLSTAPITQLIGGLTDQVGGILDSIVNLPGQDGDDTGLEDIIKDLIDDLINIVDSVIDDVLDLLDDLIGQIEDLIDNGIDLLEDLIDIVVELVQDLVDVVTEIVNDLVDGIENIVDQVIETVSDLIDDASGIIDQVVGSVDGLLENLNELLTDVTDTAGNVLDNVGGLLETLLGGEPEEGTAGTVDQIVDLITDQVDGLLGTDTGSLDDGLNSVTTDVQELLTGDQTLTEVVDSLLGGEPEAGTAGSVDQVVDGATDLVDQLIGTDTENLDDGLNALTTDVQELLTGDQTLTEVVD
ncbi:retention module-containing protein, partial [Thiomicrorhabdus sp. 6S3-12]|uniref:retention module-containing protein n=1 Tax=Thiomicrorhabdus sp. 6S3-12 TaxID=2819681 RepID=UPI001AAD12F6